VATIEDDADETSDSGLRAVYDAIDGRVPAAHGSRDMPIWGTAFKGYVASGSETLVRGRILELILYLESMQRQ
jgi:hypothetical protein